MAPSGINAAASSKEMTLLRGIVDPVDPYVETMAIVYEIDRVRG